MHYCWYSTFYEQLFNIKDSHHIFFRNDFSSCLITEELESKSWTLKRYRQACADAFEHLHYWWRKCSWRWGSNKPEESSVSLSPKGRRGGTANVSNSETRLWGFALEWNQNEWSAIKAVDPWDWAFSCSCTDRAELHSTKRCHDNLHRRCCPPSCMYWRDKLPKITRKCDFAPMTKR